MKLDAAAEYILSILFIQAAVPHPEMSTLVCFALPEEALKCANHDGNLRKFSVSSERLLR